MPYRGCGGLCIIRRPTNLAWLVADQLFSVRRSHSPQGGSALELAEYRLASGVVIIESAAGSAQIILFRSQSGQVVTMASGWAPDSAVQDQIDDTVTDGVLRARARLPTGDGAVHCVECGDEIPAARRRALAGVKTCIGCQSTLDRRPVNIGFNRRGSKDSQLR
jgi:phage/conjugal plasmid C-4 type zinc finger TraR family protein